MNSEVRMTIATNVGFKRLSKKEFERLIGSAEGHNQQVEYIKRLLSNAGYVVKYYQDYNSMVVFDSEGKTLLAQIGTLYWRQSYVKNQKVAHDLYRVLGNLVRSF